MAGSNNASAGPNADLQGAIQATKDSREKVDANQQEINKATKNIDAWTKKRDAAQADINSTQSDIDALNEKIEAEQQKINDAAAKQDKLINWQDDPNKTPAENQTERDALNNEVNIIYGIDEYGNYDPEKDLTQGYQAQIDEYQNTIDTSYKPQLDDAQARYDDAVKNIDGWQNVLDKAQTAAQSQNEKDAAQANPNKDKVVEYGSKEYEEKTNKPKTTEKDASQADRDWSGTNARPKSLNDRGYGTQADFKAQQAAESNKAERDATTAKSKTLSGGPTTSERGSGTLADYDYQMQNPANKTKSLQAQLDTANNQLADETTKRMQAEAENARLQAEMAKSQGQLDAGQAAPPNQGQPGQPNPPAPQGTSNQVEYADPTKGPQVNPQNPSNQAEYAGPTAGQQGTQVDAAQAAPPNQQDTTAMQMDDLKKAIGAIHGDYGNGAERQAALGDDYTRIQGIWNSFYDNGQLNMDKFTAAQETIKDYDAARNEKYASAATADIEKPAEAQAEVNLPEA